MKTCRVPKALKLLAEFQWSEIKYGMHVLTLILLGPNSTRVFPSIPLKDLFTTIDGTLQAKEGGSGEICPTTT